MASSGAAGKGATLALSFAALASVATPLLDMSARVLTFHHTYLKGQAIQILTQPLTLRNISKLPLDFALRLTPPFYIDKPQLQLACFEAATVNVSFDPNFKGDLQSGMAKQKLQVMALRLLVARVVPHMCTLQGPACGVAL